jgi:hypothetical protein
VAEQSGRKTGKRKGAKKRERERKAIKAVKRAALAKRADAKAEAPAAKTKTRKAVPGASPATTVANLLRVGPDRRRPPAWSVTVKTPRRPWRRAPTNWPTCRSVSTPRAGAEVIARCCW